MRSSGISTPDDNPSYDGSIAKFSIRSWAGEVKSPAAEAFIQPPFAAPG